MDTLTSTPAATNFDRLKAKLRELFELDKADLDFGIYRILRQRHSEITEFLDRHLETTVREVLAGHGDTQQQSLKDELAKLETNLKAAEIDPDTSPKVKELRAKLGAGVNPDEAANEVYSHLFKFFSRYYEEGDFLGLHRSTVAGKERYMIPYNGEEVKLVWANMDQYYIKSSELLRDYTFRLKKADLTAGALDFDENEPEEATVHFKLVEGDTEKDNRKADSKTERRFALDEETPFVEDGPASLTIRFRYREFPAQKGGKLQDKLNDDTLDALSKSLPEVWKARLFATLKSKDPKETRTYLQKHLRSYTAKHQFDYFIHKDLGGFLRRELDFYIKNEVMHLDDIEEAGAAKAEEYLSKIKAVRRCASPIIGMLAQLEDFQKKLWLKKKFVVETRYCLTLDRVPEELYLEIVANDAQWKEWNELFDHEYPRNTSERLSFLQENQFLMIDTDFFNDNDLFIKKLISCFSDLEKIEDGILIKSDNLQSLNLVTEKCRNEVDCIYIDPPYNTNSSPIDYKNGYKSSSWIGLIEDRLTAGKELLNEKGVLVTAIDDEQQKELGYSITKIFKNLLGTIIVRSNPSGRPTQTGYAVSHEYLIFAGANPSSGISRMPPTPEQSARFSQNDDEGSFEWRNLRREGSDSDRNDRRSMYYPIYITDKSIRIPKMTWDDSSENWIIDELPTDAEIAVYPINEKGEEKRWRWEHNTVSKSIGKLCVRKDRSGKNYVYYKRRPHDEGVVSVSSWFDAKYSATEHGTALLKDLFKRSPFSYPKSLYAVQDAIYISGAVKRTSLTVDYFGGSGTTAHAVIDLNRKDNGKRKYMLTEMGGHFDRVLIPRIKKVVFASSWKDGKPVTHSTGISHAFKILKLESYEDALNNLIIRRTPEQQAALDGASDAAKDEYLMGYFLDVETEGSASLLNVEKFRDPFNYKMHIATDSAGETKETNVDLVETFNWLIGLKVKHMDFPKGFVTVTGEKRTGARTLVIWRTLGDDLKADNLALEKVLERLSVNPADSEYECIYINGSHTLPDPHNKIHLIEEEFQRRMFESESFESLG